MVLEAVLLSHPAVAEAAVIACPDDEAGEIPWAFVVRREAVSAGDLITFVAQRVAPHEKIRRAGNEVPKSRSGKILRRVLAERNACHDPGRDRAMRQQHAGWR